MDLTIARLMDVVPDLIYFKDLQSRFVRVNLAEALFLGRRSPGELVGKSDFDFFAPAHANAAFAVEQEIIRTGQPSISLVERLIMLDGRESWGSATKLPWRDTDGTIIGTFGLTRDVTATKHAEEKVIEERNLLRTIIDHLPSRIFVKDNQGRYVINNRAHLQSLGVEAQEQVTGRTTLDFHPGERGLQAMADDRQVLSSGEPILNQEKSDFAPEGRTHWALTTKVPLRDVRGKVTGLVGISHDITARKQIERELQRRTAQMEEELLMARQTQESFFPRTYPVFPSGVSADASALRFAHRYIAATTLGGDFFDIIPLSDTRCAILVCDVMGHGVKAGLLTALIRGIVREIGTEVGHPSHVLGELNRGLIPIIEQMGHPVFATAFFCVVDTEAGTLRFANGGHPYPFVLRRTSGTVEQLTMANPEPAAGLVEAFAYSDHECSFSPGDVLIGYTDGLFEACNAEGNICGEERLTAFIAQNTTRPVAQLIDGLITYVQGFAGHREFNDDVCVVAVEVMASSAK